MTNKSLLAAAVVAVLFANGALAQSRTPSYNKDRNA
jgi:hypothetical protein